MPEPRTITPAQAATRIRKSAVLVRSLARQMGLGEQMLLPGSIGPQWRFNEADIEAMRDRPDRRRKGNRWYDGLPKPE